MYPVETIFVEKLETIVVKGDVNSRMKDFHDLLLMIREEDLLDLQYLNDTIHETFSYRNTPLKLPLSFDNESMQTFQQLWSNHIRGLAMHRARLNLPDLLSVIEEINLCLAKVIT